MCSLELVAFRLKGEAHPPPGSPAVQDTGPLGAELCCESGPAHRPVQRVLIETDPGPSLPQVLEEETEPPRALARGDALPAWPPHARPCRRGPASPRLPTRTGSRGDRTDGRPRGCLGSLEEEGQFWIPVLTPEVSAETDDGRPVSHENTGGRPRTGVQTGPARGLSPGWLGGRAKPAVP